VLLERMTPSVALLLQGSVLRAPLVTVVTVVPPKMPPVPPPHGTTSWSFSTASSGQAAQESLHASLSLLREGSARDVSLSAATKSSSASEGAGGGGLSAAQEGEDLIYRLRSAVDKVCYRGEVGQKTRAFIRPRPCPFFASLLRDGFVFGAVAGQSARAGRRRASRRQPP
jgi:hypothetical protein